MAPTVAPCPSCDCTKEVEWQIALFWMISLALNSISQPSGRVCGLSTKNRLLLRSSPVICAFDAVEVVALWISYVCLHRETPLEAARRIAEARFRDDGNETEGDDGLTRLEKNRSLRWVLFVLGTLPQAIKLFASSGVPWLKAWGAMYLGSWTVLEVLIWFAAVHDDRPDSNPRHGQSTLIQITPLPLLLLLEQKPLRTAWALGEIIGHNALLAFSLRVRADTPLIYLQFFTDFGVPAAFWLILLYYENFEGAEALILFTAGSIFFPSLSSIMFFEEKDSSWGVFLLVLLWAGYSAMILALIFMFVMPKNSLKWILRKLRGEVGLNMAFHVVFMRYLYVLSFYFAWIYTAKGTSIPDWVRWLG